MRSLFILALDPGETMGWCILHNAQIYKGGQASMIGKEGETIEALLGLDVDMVVYEDYRVYAKKALQHINSELYTPKLIGRIEQEAYKKQIPITSHMASEGKAFVTDDKILKWQLVKSITKENRHMIDSIRHAVHFSLFGELPDVEVVYKT